MGIFKKIRPLRCAARAIIDLMEQRISSDAPELELTVEYLGAKHIIGILSDDKVRKKYFDTQLYLDQQNFGSLSAFAKEARLGGKRFAEIEDIAVLRDRDVGDPRGNKLLASNEIKEYENTIGSYSYSL